MPASQANRPCWFCGSDVENRKKSWQRFCDKKCRHDYHWWNDGWQRRYGVNINLWAILDRQKCRCNLCRKFLHRTWEIDHIVPLDNGGKTEESNLQALCKACNKGKWTMSTEDYIKHCARVLRHQKALAKVGS